MVLLAVIAVGAGTLYYVHGMAQGSSINAGLVNRARPHGVTYAEDRDKIRDKASTFMRSQQFDQFETLVKDLRTSNVKTDGGWSELGDAYSGADAGLKYVEQEQGVEAVHKLLTQWKKLKPDSLAEVVVEANYGITAAWEARGSGWASSVRESQWNVFHNEMLHARQALDEAGKITGVFDPQILAVRARIAKGLGPDRDDIKDIVGQAITKCPDYEPIYDNVAELLLPRWYGKPGDVERFAEDMAKKLPPPTGDIIYARIAMMVRGYEGKDFYKNSAFKYPRLLSAYKTLIKAYPNGASNRRELFFFAALAKDSDTSRQMLAEIGDKWPPARIESVWGSQGRFESYKAWAEGKGPDPDYVSPLEIAINEGNLDDVTSAVTHGADVNSTTSDGMTPLLAALYKHDDKISQYLAKHGANLLAASDGDIKVATAALTEGSTEVLKMCLDAGQPLNGPVTPPGWTLMHVAAYRNSMTGAEFLLSQPGIEVDSKLPHGNTPLYLAAEANNVDMARLLVKHGADVNSKDQSLICPLHIAAYKGNVEMIRFLLEAGANPDVKSDCNISPLETAERNHQADAIKVLQNARKI